MCAWREIIHSAFALCMLLSRLWGWTSATLPDRIYAMFPLRHTRRNVSNSLNIYESLNLYITPFAVEYYERWWQCIKCIVCALQSIDCSTRVASALAVREPVPTHREMCWCMSRSVWWVHMSPIHQSHHKPSVCSLARGAWVPSFFRCAVSFPPLPLNILIRILLCKVIVKQEKTQ